MLSATRAGSDRHDDVEREATMELWWASLDLSLQIFYAIAILSSGLLGLQLLLLVFGFDGDADMDMQMDAHPADGGGVLSLRSITAFFTGFGWAGVIALKAGWPLLAALLAASLTGGVLMGSVYFLMRTLYGMRYSGTLDYKTAVGRSGQVYLAIPGRMRGPGQIEVLVQGRLAIVSAMTRAAELIPNRARVRVVEALDSQTVLVEPLDTASAAASGEVEATSPATGIESPPARTSTATEL